MMDKMRDTIKHSSILEEDCYCYWSFEEFHNESLFLKKREFDQVVYKVHQNANWEATTAEVAVKHDLQNQTEQSNS